MPADRIIEVLLGVLTLVVGFTTFTLATRTTRIQEKASIRGVDAGAFERARVIYEGALDTLREELVACRAELATARSDLATARNEISGLRADLASARGEIAGLHGDITGLTREITELRSESP